MKTDFTFLDMQRSKLITANIKIDSCINWESFDWKLKRLKNNQILTWPGQLDLPLCFAQQQWDGVVPMWFTITPGCGASSQVALSSIPSFWKPIKWAQSGWCSLSYDLSLSTFKYRLHSSGWAYLPKLPDLSRHASKGGSRIKKR